MKKRTDELIKNDILVIDGEQFKVTEKPFFDNESGLYVLVTDQVPEGDCFYGSDEWEVIGHYIPRDTSFAAHCEGYC